MPGPARLWWRSLKAEALDRLEPREEAIALARAELEVTRAFGAPASLGRTLRVLGTLERDDGLDRLREAVGRRSRARRRAWSTPRRWPRWARRCGGRGSRPRRASRCGARSSWPASAAPTAWPRRSARSCTPPAPVPAATRSAASTSLTPSERRVADLAVAGRSNREIAQELYVTPKTVEVHLSNAYRKLGIRSRRELGARALGDAALP